MLETGLEGGARGGIPTIASATSLILIVTVFLPNRIRRNRVDRSQKNEATLLAPREHGIGRKRVTRDGIGGVVTLQFRIQ